MIACIGGGQGGCKRLPCGVDGGFGCSHQHLTGRCGMRNKRAVSPERVREEDAHGTVVAVENAGDKVHGKEHGGGVSAALHARDRRFFIAVFHREQRGDLLVARNRCNGCAAEKGIVLVHQRQPQRALLLPGACRDGGKRGERSSCKQQKQRQQAAEPLRQAAKFAAKEAERRAHTGVSARVSVSSRILPSVSSRRRLVSGRYSSASCAAISRLPPFCRKSPR